MGQAWNEWSRIRCFAASYKVSDKNTESIWIESNLVGKQGGLSYLKRFPIDVVKVDKSFIAEMDEKANGRALVQAIIAMSHALGLQVVAEGVGSEGQIALLRRMGCRYGQGYFFSRPIPANEFGLLKQSGIYPPAPNAS